MSTFSCIVFSALIVALASQSASAQFIGNGGLGDITGLLALTELSNTGGGFCGGYGGGCGGFYRGNCGGGNDLLPILVLASLGGFGNCNSCGCSGGCGCNGSSGNCGCGGGSSNCGCCGCCCC